MSRQLIRLICGITALVVVLAGCGYAFSRTSQYSSTAQLVAVPKTSTASEVPTLIGGFKDSGLMFTYVELAASKDTLRQAGSPAVDVTARAVPDSRVLSVTAQGARLRVRPALAGLLLAIQARQATLHDPWQLTVLQGAQPPVAVGPSQPMIVVASVLLAALGALMVWIVLTRLAPERPSPPVIVVGSAQTTGAGDEADGQLGAIPGGQTAGGA